MKTHRFFVTEKLKEHELFRSEDVDLVHQLRDVFRMKKGDNIMLFDGTGYEFPATITLLTRKEIECHVAQGTRKEDKGSGAHVFISIIKKDNFELACEKATELGVTTITPIVADRSQYKSIRHDRLEKVVREAAEQCGRVTVPEITLELPLEVALEEHPDIVVLDMKGTTDGLQDASKLCVGPEGGWSERERALFEQKGVTVCSLPFNTLRAETAVIVSVSLSVLY